MPELPEVETIRRQLNEALKGRSILKVIVLNGKSFVGDLNEAVDCEVEDVARKAKVLMISFLKSDWVIIIHLKMTGQLIFVDGEKRVVGGHPTLDWVNELPSKHTRVIWEMKDGSKLYFNDMRKFGWQKMINRTEMDTLINKMPLDLSLIHISEPTRPY